MRAHFIGSAVNLSEDVNSYSAIIQALKKSGVELTSNWVNEANKKLGLKNQITTSKYDWDNIYKENMEAISKADIVVAEVSKKSFLVGFQVSLAIQQKKPTLLLSKLDHIDSAIGVSLNEELVSYCQYNVKNIDNVISEFVAENSKEKKQIRFNFFIDKKLLNYINWRSLNTGKTKSDIIREALREDIKRSGFEKDST